MRLIDYRSAAVKTAVVVLGGLSLSACATRGYVDEQIALVNGRLDTHESRMGQVEGRVQDAISRADAAQAAANAAGTEARTAGQRIDQFGARMDAMQTQSQGRTPRG